MFYCKRNGHYIRDCAKKKKNDKKRSRDTTLAFDDSSNNWYHSTDLLVASDSSIRGQWLLNSSCSFHLYPDKSFFYAYESVIVEGF